MTSFALGICFLLCGVFVSGGIVRRVITKNLVVDNGLHFGGWGDVEYCIDNSYVSMVEVKFEPYSILHIDETAVNAVKLYCQTMHGQTTGYITSKVGDVGEWQGPRACPNGLMTGVRAKVLEYLGSEGDDVAVQNMEIQCNYGESTVMAMDDNSDLEVEPGVWSDWSECDKDSAVCGLEVRYQAQFPLEDTVGVADISLYCCSVFSPPTMKPSEE